MKRLLTIVGLSLHEATRRRILGAALLGALGFLVLYAIGFHFVAREVAHHSRGSAIQRHLVLNFFTLAGLYATNFLAALSAVLLPLDTLSGEIATGVMQTVASKPVRRVEIVLGKWLAYWIVVIGYVVLVAGGVLVVARVLGGFTIPNPIPGIALMLLEATCFVSLSIAGGSRLTTVTNGVVAFSLFGVAFIGGWIEQVASLTNNVAARNVGTVASLLVPTESMWQLAAHLMQPPLLAQLHVTPFSPASVPSPAMVFWAAGWAIFVLAIGVRSFSRREL